jgi:hypothetical protein
MNKLKLSGVVCFLAFLAASFFFSAINAETYTDAVCNASATYDPNAKNADYFACCSVPTAKGDQLEWVSAWNRDTGDTCGQIHPMSQPSGDCAEATPVYAGQPTDTVFSQCSDFFSTDYVCFLNGELSAGDCESAPN